MKNPVKYSRTIFGLIFSVVFFLIAIGMVVFSFIDASYDLFSNAALDGSGGAIYTLVETAGNLVIALTIFELAVVIAPEFDEDSDIGSRSPKKLSLSLPRFIGVIVCATTLEGLILVIEYKTENQVHLMANAVWVIAAGALLLIAMGIYVKLLPRYILELLGAAYSK